MLNPISKEGGFFLEGGGRGKLEFCETEQKDDIFYIKMKLKNKNKNKKTKLWVTGPPGTVILWLFMILQLRGMQPPVDIRNS